MSFNAAYSSDPYTEIPLPAPWIREFDENFKTFYFVNPLTDPPTIQWDHPLLPPGQPAPEQLAALHIAQSPGGLDAKQFQQDQYPEPGSSYSRGEAASYLGSPQSYGIDQQADQSRQLGDSDRGLGKAALIGVGSIAAIALLSKMFKNSGRHSSGYSGGGGGSGMMGNYMGGGSGQYGNYYGNPGMGPPPFMGMGGIGQMPMGMPMMAPMGPMMGGGMYGPGYGQGGGYGGYGYGGYDNGHHGHHGHHGGGHHHHHHGGW